MAAAIENNKATRDGRNRAVDLVEESAHLLGSFAEVVDGWRELKERSPHALTSK